MGKYEPPTPARDPGDAVPPGVAPQAPVPLTEQDRAVLDKLRRQSESSDAEPSATTRLGDRATGNGLDSLTGTYRPTNQGDLGEMSDKVQGMARDMAGRAQQTFGNTVGDAQTQAKGMYNQASGQAQEQAARLGEVIRDQPLTATIIALGVGYILGRLTS